MHIFFPGSRYAEDQGFLLYPTVQVWAEHDPAFQLKTLWTSAGARPTTVTLENIVDPQYVLALLLFRQ